MCLKGKDINPKLSMTNRIAVMQVKKSKASTAQWHNSQRNKFSLSELRRLSWGMMGYYTKSCQSIKHMENPVRKTPKE
jgi:hypothetical protein